MNSGFSHFFKLHMFLMPYRRPNLLDYRSAENCYWKKGMPKIEVEVMSSEFWQFFVVVWIWGELVEQQSSVWSDMRGSILAHDSSSVGLAFMTLLSTAWLWNDLFSNRGEAKTSYAGPQKAKVLHRKANMAGLFWRHLARIVMIF